MSYKLLAVRVYKRRSSFGRLKVKEQDSVGMEDDQFMTG
jgi:hypothetical protein